MRPMFVLCAVKSTPPHLVVRVCTPADSISGALCYERTQSRCTREHRTLGDCWDCSTFPRLFPLHRFINRRQNLHSIAVLKVPNHTFWGTRLCSGAQKMETCHPTSHLNPSHLSVEHGPELEICTKSLLNASSKGGGGGRADLGRQSKQERPKRSQKGPPLRGCEAVSPQMPRTMSCAVGMGC